MNKIVFIFFIALNLVFNDINVKNEINNIVTERNIGYFNLKGRYF